MSNDQDRRAQLLAQGRIEELADKCTEGRLTPEERDEYEAMIRVGNFVRQRKPGSHLLPLQCAQGTEPEWT
jgi:hypothetical protein